MRQSSLLDDTLRNEVTITNVFELLFNEWRAELYGIRLWSNRASAGFIPKREARIKSNTLREAHCETQLFLVGSENNGRSSEPIANKPGQNGKGKNVSAFLR